MTELRTGTRKGFVVILVPNGENVRKGLIGGTRKVFAVWGHAEFAEGTRKRHTKSIRSGYCPEWRECANGLYWGHTKLFVAIGARRIRRMHGK